MSFKGHHPPSKFTFAANTLFALSGLFNFILFFITRPSWVVGAKKQGEHHQQSGSQAREHGRAPPDSPRALDKDSDSTRDEDYLPHIVATPRTALPERQTTGQGFLPPGRL